MSLNVDLLRQLSTVDGLLAGFALAGAIRFVAGPEKSPRISISIIALLSASILLITTTSLAVLLLDQPPLAELPGITIIVTDIFVVLSLFGLASLLTGIAAAAWVFSKPIGVTITVVASISFLLIMGAWLALP